jgi:tetratricopeptide (TPR) repeat protein
LVLENELFVAGQIGMNALGRGWKRSRRDRRTFSGASRLSELRGGWGSARHGQREALGRPFVLILLEEIGEGEILLHSALDTYAKLGFRKVGGLYLDLGSARSARGDIAGARDFFARALKQFEEDQDEANIAITAGTLADAEFHGGDPQAAVRRAQDALAASHLAPAISVWIQSNMAAFLIALGRFDEARQCAHAALRNALHLQLEFLIIVLLQHLAATLALEPNAQPGPASSVGSELAAQLTGYVDSRIREIDVAREFTERQEYERMLAALTCALGVERLTELMADGSMLKEERAVDLALSASLAHVKDAGLGLARAEAR